MRKFISVAIVLLMVAAMLSTGALADNGKGQKGGAGAGNDQNQGQASSAAQGDKGNSHRSDDAPAGQIHQNPDLGNAGETSGNENGNKERNSSETANEEKNGNGSANGNEEKNDGETANKEKNGGETLNGNQEMNTGNGNMGETTGGGMKNGQENKPDEKLQEGPNHGNAYGRVRNEQEVLDDIGQLAGEGNAAQLNTLMAAYREAKDAETAKTTLAALLDALTQTCTAAAVNGNGDAAKIQEQLALMEQLREKVMENAGNDNGTLLALMHAYENIFRVMNNLEPIVEPEDGAETDTETGTDAVPEI